MKNRIQSKRKIKLERLGGCENCDRPCLHNQAVALPDIAKRSKGHLFRCNNHHSDYGKNSEV